MIGCGVRALFRDAEGKDRVCQVWSGAGSEMMVMLFVVFLSEMKSE